MPKLDPTLPKEWALDERVALRRRRRRRQRCASGRQSKRPARQRMRVPFGWGSFSNLWRSTLPQGSGLKATPTLRTSARISREGSGTWESQQGTDNRASVDILRIGTHVGSARRQLRNPALAAEPHDVGGAAAGVLERVTISHTERPRRLARRAPNWRAFFWLTAPRYSA